MRKKVRIAACVLLVLAVAGGLSLWALFRAASEVPEFYQQAIAQDKAAAEHANDECLRQAAALASNLHKQGRWQTIFTSEQINGWLAVDLVRNYPDLLPPEVEKPRVAIDDKSASIGCQFHSVELTGVLSLSFDVYLTEPNTIAFRIRGARAGRVPIPLSTVLDTISNAAHELELPLKWQQTGGDPVALVKIPPPRDEQDNALELDCVELRKGELYLAGRTLRPGESSSATEPPPPTFDEHTSAETPRGPVAQVPSAGTNQNVQR